NAARALIGDHAINNRQVNSSGQAGFEAAGTVAIVTCRWKSKERHMAGAGQKPIVGEAVASGSDDRAFAAMTTRANALIPQLRDRAERTEELRRLPPETERDLHEAGLFRVV